jgi:hypothetical protein
MHMVTRGRAGQADSSVAPVSLQHSVKLLRQLTFFFFLMLFGGRSVETHPNTEISFCF